MAIAINALGACNIKVDTGTSNALEQLGYNEDSVGIQENPKRHDVHSDQNGGTPGIPIEVQNLGEEHMVTLNLSNFDWSIWQKIQAGTYGTTEGTVGTIGAFLSTNGFRLLLDSTSNPRNYLNAHPITKSVPMGTKASIIVIQFRCLPVAGVLFNATDT
jgi:hypothetical protein